MLRVLLAAMVPCFAIGFTGLLVTSIGRTLLFAGHGTATVVALVITVLIMLDCSIATFVIPRRRAIRPTTTVHH